MSGLVKAQTKLIAPLFIKDGKNITPVKIINQKHGLVGLGKIPEFLVIENHETSFSKAYDDYSNEIPELIETINKKYKKEYSVVIGNYPGELDKKETVTCYKGNPKELIDIFDGVGGFLYFEDLVYLGWRIKEKIVIAPFFASRFETAVHANRYLSQHLTLWNTWQQSSQLEMSALFAIAYETDLSKVKSTQISQCH